jgi:enterochelin esterase family protein
MSARGRVTLLSHTSALLAKNPLGDPHVRETPVYLPAAYEESERRRFPVVYVLAGFTGTGRMLLNVPTFDEPLPERLDRLIASGAMPPAIAVMPDCATRFGGSQYIDSVGTGPYMSYLVRELVPEVDRLFRTIPRREARAVVGKSSGGFGALVLAMEHPEVFGACGSHSGDCYFDYLFPPDFCKFVRTMRKKGGVASFLTDFSKAPIKEKDDIDSILIVAMAQAYSPNPTKPPPLNFDLPFDLETGELDRDVFARWKAWDPVERCASGRDALLSLRALYLDAGDRDEYFLDLGARVLSKKLAALGVAHRHEEFRGGHFNVQSRYDASLPFIAKALVTRE